MCACIERRKNETAANLIIESVRDTLETFNVTFSREDARIVSGTEESTTGWISINYVLSNFGVNFVSIERRSIVNINFTMLNSLGLL